MDTNTVIKETEIKLEPLDSIESLYDLCRLCAKTNSFMIPLLEEDFQHNLFDKINQYLPICVTEYDKLPLQICDNCATTILTFHDLHQSCLDAQIKLLQLLEKLNIKIPENICSNKSDGITRIKNFVELNPLTNNNKLILENKTTVNNNDKALEFMTEIKLEITTSNESEKLKSGQKTKENEELISKNHLQSLKTAKEASTNLKKIVQQNVKHRLPSKTPTVHSCEVCGKSFKYKSYLNNHFKIHTNIYAFKCDLCNKGFHKNYLLQTHMHKHTGTKPYVCDYCNRSFRLKRGLKHHIFIHSGEKPYNCNDCGRNFSRYSTLIKHKRSHSDYRPYSCKYCKKSFRQHTTMKIHTRIHSGERPYICSTCNTSFARKDTWRKHLITHTDDKPYTCKICPKSFRVRRSLKKHEFKHHKIHPEKFLGDKLPC